MTDKSEEEDRSIYLRLVLGLLPFEVDITISAVNDLLSEAEATSWPAVMRRSANFGLVLSTLGLVGLLLLLYPLVNLANTPLGSIGPIYRFAIAAVALMWIAKFLLGLLQNIDTGDSPVVPREESNRITSFFEFMIGVAFVGLISIPLVQLWSWDLLLSILLAITSIGIAVTGICLTISGAYGVISESSKVEEEVPVGSHEERRSD